MLRISTGKYDEIDLHGTTVFEAVIIVKEILQEFKCSPSMSPSYIPSRPHSPILPPPPSLFVCRPTSQDHHWERLSLCKQGGCSETRDQEFTCGGRVDCRRLGCRSCGPRTKSLIPKYLSLLNGGRKSSTFCVQCLLTSQLNLAVILLSSVYYDYLIPRPPHVMIAMYCLRVVLSLSRHSVCLSRLLPNQFVETFPRPTFSRLLLRRLRVQCD